MKRWIPAQVQQFGVNATALFIARLANDDVELGYYDGVTRIILRTVTPATTDIFSNIGFYADLRADGATITSLDNLRIVPEPAALSLLAPAAQDQQPAHRCES